MNSVKSYPSGGTAKRTAMGSFMTLMTYGIRSIEQIVLVPLFIFAWGRALYGEWITLSSVIGYFAISDLGMGNYVTNKMTQIYSRGELKEYGKVFKSALGIYSLISLALFLVLAGFSIFIPFLDWFNIEIASSFSARLSVVILGSYLILGTLSSLINSLYASTGEFSRSRVIAGIRELLLIGFIAVVLLSGGHFIGVSLVYLICLLAYTVFMFFDAVRRHKEINFRESRMDWGLAKSFILPGLIFLLIPISNIIYVQGSVLVVSFFLGSVAVAAFGVHRTLANFIYIVTSFINPAIKPELAADEVRGNYEKIRLIHGIFMKVSLLVSTGLAIFLYFNGENILRIWTRGQIGFQPELWMVFLVLVPVLSFGNFTSSFQEATNKYNKYALSRIISSILGLILAIIFVKLWGLIGVLLGFLATEILINFWYVPFNTLKIIKESKIEFVVSFLGVLPMVVLELLAGWFISVIFNNAWIKIALTGLIIMLAGMIYVYFAWFDNKEKLIVDNFIGKLKRKIFKLAD